MDDFLIDVLSSKMTISVCRFYFYDIFTYFKDRNIKCTSTKVEYCNFFVFLFIKSVCKSRCSWFVDDSFDIESSNFTSIFCCLSLCIIKICRHSNDRFCNRLSNFCFSICFKFLEYHRRNFFWSIRFFSHFHFYSVICRFLYFKRNRSFIFLNCRIIECVSDKTFNSEDGIFWIRYTLSFREKPHESFVCF